MATISSYSETNQDSSLSQSSANRQGVGQAFTMPASSYVLTQAKFYLQIGTGSPTGNMTVRIYAVTGTVGVAAVPTGSVLAESDAIDASTLGAGFALVTFNFSGANQITLSASTNYAVVLWYPNGDGSNNINNGDDTSSQSSGGNFCQTTNSGVSWTSSGTIGMIYYVIGNLATSIKTINGLARASVKTVNGLAIASVKSIDGLA